MLNELDPTVGITAFVVNIKAPLCEDSKTSDELLDPSQVHLEPYCSKTKILIYEEEVFSQIALETIIFDELKLRNHTQFFSSAKSIVNAIQTLYEERGQNQVALVILDYKMAGMTGAELISWTRQFMGERGVEPENMPHFAFRAQQYYELQPDIAKQL